MDEDLKFYDLDALKQRREQARIEALDFGEKHRGRSLDPGRQQEWERLSGEYKRLDAAVGERGRHDAMLRKSGARPGEPGRAGGGRPDRADRELHGCAP